MTTPKPLEAWVSRWIAKETLSPDYHIGPLDGDGSTRQFFRLFIRSTSKTASFILLYDPSWTLSQDYPAHQQLLKSTIIQVPEFREVDRSAGIILMEDLGDELLQQRIEQEPTSKESWLFNAVALLAKLHGATFPLSPSVPAATRRFDARKYREEFQFTIDHLHEGLLDLGKLGSEVFSNITSFCERLEKLSPEVFAHRDYHCRNLLVHQNSLYMIDFQDARLGPPHYDLASLVYDAYVPTSEMERKSIISHYKNESHKYPLYDAIDWDNLEGDLKLVAFQRTVKAAGSFASFYTRFKKKTHLKYLVPALRHSIELRMGFSKEMVGFARSLPIEKWIETFEKLKLDG